MDDGTRLVLSSAATLAGILLGLPLGQLVAYSPIGAVEAVEIDGEPFTAVTIAPDGPEDLELWRCMKVGIGEELPALDAGALATESCARRSLETRSS